MNVNTTKTNKESRNDRGKHFLSGFITNDFLRDFFIDPTSINTPSSNVSENNEEFKIELGIPYLEKDDLKVIVDRSNLVVLGFGGKNNESEEAPNITLRKSFQLPEIIDQSNITAKYKDDILQIHLPKKESFQQKLTVIEIG